MSILNKIILLMFIFSFSYSFSFELSPNDSYENYINAIKTGDIKAVIQYSNPDAKLTEEEFLSALPSMQKYMPENIEYTKEIIVDDLALIYAKGDFFNPHTKNEEICDGVIKLNKVKNTWKIKRNYWRCTIKSAS